MSDVRLIRYREDYSSNCYLITSSGECAIVDPSVPYSDVGAKVRYILLTHAHFDHILEIDDWVKYTGATVIVSEYDKPSLSDEHRNCYYPFLHQVNGYYGDSIAVSDGDTLPLGDTFIRVISCPGHTAGSLTYLVDNDAFVGDTVFAGGGFGRYDLPSGDVYSLAKSIDNLLTLDGGVTLYPGHGPSTTVSEYKRFYIPIIQ